MLLDLTFPYTTRMLFAYFACKDFGDTDFDGKLDYFLVEELRVPCYDDAWYKLLPLVVLSSCVYCVARHSAEHFLH